MTLQQGITFAIILGVMALFLSDRLRYDLVAATGLLAGLVTKVISPADAFRGFSDDIVIIVGSALVVSAAIERSGIVDRMAGPLLKHMRTPTRQVMMMSTAVAVSSAFIKNIGALAIFLPLAMQVGRKNGVSPSRFLMPMAFSALLGGIATEIGTSPNIIASRMREQLLGHPFHMFDYTPVGATLAICGVAFLSVGWRLVPERRPAGAGQSFPVSDYTVEACVPPGSPFVGKTVRDFEEAADGDAAITAIIREGGHRYRPAGHWMIFENDMLVLECDATVLKRMVALAKLVVPEADEADEGVTAREDMGVVEAVVTKDSVLIGSSAEEMGLRDLFGITLLALSRRGVRVQRRLRQTRLEEGDLLIAQGRTGPLREMLAILGCLPLAQRDIAMTRPNAWLPLAILGAAVLAAATQLTSIAVAFFCAAVLMLLTGCLKLSEAYERVEWPLLVLIACLIPLSHALGTTGGTDLIAGWLAAAASNLPPVLAVAFILFVAMGLTPFLNHAATVLMVAPVAVTLGHRLGVNPDAFLMAVAVGSGCDFLTPVGHQCNTLVMGPGGYRFGDFWRVGLPLSVLVLIIAPPMLTALWPLR